MINFMFIKKFSITKMIFGKLLRYLNRYVTSTTAERSKQTKYYWVIVYEHLERKGNFCVIRIYFNWHILKAYLCADTTHRNT